MKCRAKIIVDLFLLVLSAASLTMPVMRGYCEGINVSGILEIRGFNLLEFAPAAWLLPVVAPGIVFVNIAVHDTHMQLTIARWLYAFAFAAFVTSLPYAWRWLGQEAGAASICWGIVCYPLFILTLLLRTG